MQRNNTLGKCPSARIYRRICIISDVNPYTEGICIIFNNSMFPSDMHPISSSPFLFGPLLCWAHMQRQLQCGPRPDHYGSDWLYTAAGSTRCRLPRVHNYTSPLACPRVPSVTAILL